MYSRILTPLDGSSLSERAISHAAELARGTGAEIILIRVVHDPLADVPEAGQSTETQATAETASRAAGYLAGIASRLAGEGLKVRTEVSEGDPASEILGLAHREDVDAIVMSTHGRSGLSRLFMGSVAEQVALTTKRPVMLIKPERPRAERKEEAESALGAP